MVLEGLSYALVPMKSFKARGAEKAQEATGIISL